MVPNRAVIQSLFAIPEVAQRGELGWFRRCPLRLHNFHHDSLFSFRHKSIQENLVGPFPLLCALTQDRGKR